MKRNYEDKFCQLVKVTTSNGETKYWLKSLENQQYEHMRLVKVTTPNGETEYQLYPWEKPPTEDQLKEQAHIFNELIKYGNDFIKKLGSKN